MLTIENYDDVDLDGLCDFHYHRYTLKKLKGEDFYYDLMMYQILMDILFSIMRIQTNE